MAKDSRILRDELEREEEAKMLAIADELNLVPLNLSRYKIDPKILEIIPEQLARSYHLIPISQMGSIITVAMSEPGNILAVDDIRAITGLEIQAVVATTSQIIKSIDTYYGGKVIKPEFTEEEDKLLKLEEIEFKVAEVSPERPDVKEMTRLSHQAPVINMVNRIIETAIERRASDIHIEPYAARLRIRYRIDGVLHEVESSNKEFEHAIVARIKIISRLDITQRRLPQDGRFSLKLKNKEVDFRVSIMPIQFGEKVVLRILEKSMVLFDLDRLGFSEYALNSFKQAIEKPFGMILLTGPTGSGKSTTLYSILNRLNSPQKNLITIEDPVEYQLRGITQIQIKPEIGLGFVNILRAILRQNPDVIMIGEIRDAETADIAMKAALTGHMVLSTLHTNDAASAITRLVDMGVEPFLVAGSLSLVAAQRLCRKVCPECKESHRVSVEGLSGIPKDIKETNIEFYRGKGCPYCNKTGYFGRIAVTEVLNIDDSIRQMILERSSLDEIENYARAKGMKTLREDAIDKGLSGETSLEEILRVTPEA